MSILHASIKTQLVWAFISHKPNIRSWTWFESHHVSDGANCHAIWIQFDIQKKKWKSGHKRRLLSVCLSFLLIIFTTLCFTILLFSFFIYFFLVWKERSFCIDLRLLYSWDLPHKQFFILNKFIFKKTFALLIVFDELSLIRLHHFKF